MFQLLCSLFANSATFFQNIKKWDAVGSFLTVTRIKINVQLHTTNIKSMMCLHHQHFSTSPIKEIIDPRGSIQSSSHRHSLLTSNFCTPLLYLSQQFRKREATSIAEETSVSSAARQWRCRRRWAVPRRSPSWRGGSSRWTRTWSAGSECPGSKRAPTHPREGKKDIGY